jgi:hypothetical protein
MNKIIEALLALVRPPWCAACGRHATRIATRRDTMYSISVLRLALLITVLVGMVLGVVLIAFLVWRHALLLFSPPELSAEAQAAILGPRTKEQATKAEAPPPPPSPPAAPPAAPPTAPSPKPEPMPPSAGAAATPHAKPAGAPVPSRET